MYLSRNWLIVFGVLLCADVAHAQLNVPVTVPVCAHSVPATSKSITGKPSTVSIQRRFIVASFDSGTRTNHGGWATECR